METTPNMPGAIFSRFSCNFGRVSVGFQLIFDGLWSTIAARLTFGFYAGGASDSRPLGGRLQDLVR